MFAIVIAVIATGYSLVWLGVQNLREPQKGWNIQSIFTCQPSGVTSVPEPGLPSGWINSPTVPNTPSAPGKPGAHIGPGYSPGPGGLVIPSGGSPY